MFANFTLFNLAQSLIHMIKFKESKRMRKLLLILKASILIFFLAYISKWYFEMIETFKQNRITPVRREIAYVSYELSQPSLAICINVQNAIVKNYNLSVSVPYYNHTYSELERLTNDAYKETVEEISLEFQNKKLQVKVVHLSKVIFEYWVNDVMRCFLVRIEISQPKYQSLFKLSKLFIKFKHNKYALFVLPDTQKYMPSFSTSKWFHLTGQRKFILTIKKRSRFKPKNRCIDYKKVYNHCNSR